jgi:hypothetical protein
VAKLDSSFSDVSPGVELENGSFLFIDRTEVVLYVADLKTFLIRRLGRSGAGPAEFRRPERVVADGKGGAIVPDAALRRALLISPSGELQGTGFVTSSNDGISATRIRGFDPAGRFLYNGTIASGGSRDSLPILRWDPNTKQSTLMAWWPMVKSILGPVVREPDGTTSQTVSLPQLWPKRTAWLALPNGSIALVRPDPYRVETIDSGGRVVRGPVVPFRALRVTTGEREAVRRDRGPMPDNQFPATLPPFEGTTGVLSTPFGEVWVERMRAWNDSIPAYDVFDSTGTLTNRARLRPHSRVVGFGDHTIYVARQTPEDGLWYLEMYRRQ